ncbi:exosome component 1 [Plakobranchus ocellatus]|uniref:Exosome component 1 n=1 Tax=Plakobranchus ocellatus TaxID=259542 RepID=A0AAV4BWX9_9GAST|nr:exosome component 1 [Plakobranchus ocellatus]
MAAPMPVCIPGRKLCKESDTHLPGTGTYTRNGFIYSSLVGTIRETTDESNVKTISVIGKENNSIIPYIDAIVVARVTNVNPRFCKCEILSVGKHHLQDAFRGMIRKEDVRALDRDRIEMHKCFRPGDIIIARVMSLGDAQSYLLTTAENELGVVSALSESGK